MSHDSTQKNVISQGYTRLLQVQKRAGETLAALLLRLRGEYGIPADVPMTYAGRLDPMAEGLMIVLVGDACHDKEMYMSRSKTYEFEVLLGVSTDTQDMLGVVTDTAFGKEVSLEQVQKAIQTLNTKTLWQYPAYSSRTVNGVPLFVSARKGSLPTELPTKEGKILSSQIREIGTVVLSDVVDQKLPIIRLVVGDFRQEEIIQSWKKMIKEKGNEEVQIISCIATVTSGVYIRTIASELGKLLGIPALAYSIERTGIEKI